jgi:hypothetical protein
MSVELQPVVAGLREPLLGSQASKPQKTMDLQASAKKIESAALLRTNLWDFASIPGGLSMPVGIAAGIAGICAAAGVAGAAVVAVPLAITFGSLVGAAALLGTGAGIAHYQVTKLESSLEKDGFNHREISQARARAREERDMEDRRANNSSTSTDWAAYHAQRHAGYAREAARMDRMDNS